MPKIYEKNPECIFCGTHVFILRKRFVTEERTGSRKQAGEYYSCRCGALTFGSSGFNQRETRK